MSLQVLGRDGSILDVTKDGKVRTSNHQREMFSWTIITYDMTAADTVLAVRNTSSTKGLHITKVVVSADVAGLVDFHVVNGSAALAGTALTGVSLNGPNASTAEADAVADETTNSSQGNVILTLECPAASAEKSCEWDFEGDLVLANNQALGIDMAAEAAACQASIFGYYEPIE